MRFFPLLVLLLLPLVRYWSAPPATRRPAATADAATYDLEHPVSKYSMPAALREVSGVVVLPQNRLACMEDQTGTIYLYNATTKRVEETIAFGPKGDYEDLARVGEAWFVLRSDGTLFKRLGTQTTTYDTGLTRDNNPEGLAYEPATKSLLVACKGAAGTGGPDQYRAVYRLDPATFRRTLKPAYLLDVAALRARNPAVNRFAPSGIAVHPATGHVFITAASGNALVELDARGGLVRLDKLPRKRFPQPEGLTFAPNGDLYIASEAGTTDTGTIQVFRAR